MAQFRESINCNKHLCESKIYATRDHSLAMQALKKKILSEGIANFETDPRYVRLMQCKKSVDETYYSEQECKGIFTSRMPAPPYRPPQPPFNPRTWGAPPNRPPQPPFDPRTWGAPPNRPPQPQPQPPLDPRTWGAPPKQRPVKPCTAGKIRNPATGRCINDPALKATKKTAPKKASPAKTQKAQKPCAYGKIRNPATGRCINDPALKAKK
jgi:hypothetical protein